MPFDNKQRARLAAIFTNLGSLTFGATVLGKFVSREPFPDWIFLLGLLFSLICFIIAVETDKEI